MKKIQKALPDVAWNHCPGKLNPADIPTRCTPLTDEATKTTWLHGPEFLAKERNDWPQFPSKPVTDDVLEDVFVNVVTTDGSRMSTLIDITRHSDLRKMLCVTAYVLRFVALLKHRLE